MKYYLNWRRRNSSSIEKVNIITNNILIKDLTKRLEKLNQEIGQTTKELLEVQTAGIRATLTGNNSWINKIQKRIYWSTIEKSSSFHKERLISLQRERTKVEMQLDRLNGQFWSKRIKRWVGLFLIFVIMIFALWILLLGLLATLYVLPIWGLILLTYLFFQKSSINRYK